MTTFLKHEVLSKILEVGLIPTFYNGDIGVSKKIIQACVNSGAEVIEFTNRGHFAHQIFSAIAQWFNKKHPEAILGIGTVFDPATASLYINNGANFVVGPILNPEIFRICNRRKVSYIPGCSTPSEISAAEEMGADIIKIFPANALGYGFIKSVLGPSPWSKLMPSGGVKATREDIFAWIKAGASVLNIGSTLVRKDLVKAKDFEGIARITEQCILWIKEARETSG